MRKSTLALAFASVLVGGVIGGPALYADDNHRSSASIMGRGMMGDSDGGGMMGMMGMMKQMSQMMDHCNGMMGNSRPNEQWRRNEPSQPDNKE